MPIFSFISTPSIDVTEEARIDFYNTDELESWLLGLEKDRMAGLAVPDTSIAERREANEIL